MKFKFFYILVIILYLTACTGVKIDPPQLSDKVKSLAKGNSVSVSLSVTSEKEFQSLGHQYLFIVLPFGNIVQTSAQTTIQNLIFTKLSTFGFKPVSKEQTSGQTLNVHIKNMQLTAYDLIFVRKIYCEIEMDVERIDHRKNRKYSHAHKSYISRYKSLAFKRELEHIYSICLQEAVNQSLNSVGFEAVSVHGY